jgi:hypothetical protein
VTAINLFSFIARAPPARASRDDSAMMRSQQKRNEIAESAQAQGVKP